MGDETSLFKKLLIGVEGAQTPPKMLTHFPRAWAHSGELFSVLRDQRDRLTARPANRSHLERKSTAPIFR